MFGVVDTNAEGVSLQAGVYQPMLAGSAWRSGSSQRQRFLAVGKLREPRGNLNCSWFGLPQLTWAPCLHLLMVKQSVENCADRINILPVPLSRFVCFRIIAVYYEMAG